MIVTCQVILRTMSIHCTTLNLQRDIFCQQDTCTCGQVSLDEGRCGCERMVIGVTITSPISAYHH